MEELNAIEEIIQQLGETFTRLNELREQSAEVREALMLLGRKEALAQRLQAQVKGAAPQPIPYPVPVYPYSHPYGIYPWGPPWVITSSSTDVTHIEGRRLPPHRNYQESLTIVPNTSYEDKA